MSKAKLNRMRLSKRDSKKFKKNMSKFESFLNRMSLRNAKNIFDRYLKPIILRYSGTQKAAYMIDIAVMDARFILCS